MSTLQIALLGVVVLLLAGWLLHRRGNGQAQDPADRIDTLIGWPPQPTRVLSKQERIAFGLLTRALPEYIVLAQVPLARFISVPKRNSYADWLRRLGYQCADFVICDMAAQVISVVELETMQSSERARKRLTRMSRTLNAAKIPLHIWTENALPSTVGARNAIVPKPAPMPATVPYVMAPATTVPAGNPFDESGRDSTQDELIELLEPPPSTWFDDLDTDTAPLRKH